MIRKSKIPIAYAVMSILLVLGAGSALARKGHKYPAWRPAVAEVGINTPDAEGCPIETPDGLSLLFASTRPNGQGMLDIWAADREVIGAPWSEPRNLDLPINSAAADFCPTPTGRTLYFVSDRTGPDHCGDSGGDIYVSRQSPAGGWSEPRNLGCYPQGPNSTGPEFSPSFVETWYGTFLFYSSNGGDGDQDIYVSELRRDGTFGRGHVVRRLSTEFDDRMPNVRATDGGSFEVAFSSDRPTWGNGKGSFGSQDVYMSASHFLPYRWTSPRNLGPNVNTTDSETRSTLSKDGQRLHFGRGMDIYVSQRKH